MTEKGTDHFFMKHFLGWRSVLLQAFLFAAFFALLEFFFHLTEKLDFTYRFVYPMLFCLPAGFFFAGLCSLFPTKWNCILSTAVIAAVSLWFCAQICYSGTFQTYMEVSKITMAGDVVAGFGHEMSDAVLTKLPYMIVIGITVVSFSLFLFIRLKPEKKSPLLSGTSIAICLVLHLFCRGALILGGEGPYSSFDMYTQYPRILDNNIENFGVLTSLRLEVCDLVFGHDTSAVTALALADTDVLLPESTPTAAPETRVVEEMNMETVSEDVEDEPSVIKKEKNVVDIDMDALIAKEEDEQLLAIHQYVASLPGSSTNEYTGYFQGYNLIMICAESFSSRMISEELTPTLYKMANNGFVFQNYYGMFKSITTNGEYAFCTGLIPNTVGSASDLKQNSTFLLSADKYLPYCMGNVFESMGVSAYAYHGNVQSYYRRDITYPNMGYQLCRFFDGSYVNGVYMSEGNLTFSRGKSKPTSDEEMLLQTLGDYLEDRDEDGRVNPFHAYYMTYSGHHPYGDIYSGEQTGSMNPMSFLNRDRVDELEYSGVVKSYLAANLEVEDMVTALMEALEEAGCLENTVIVLTNDHYPYGLQSSQFDELAGEKVDTAFGIYENCFICYNAGMEAPVIVDTPCCTVDILPTLLNLFGVDYDSRLLAGNDILDPGAFHIAMLYNQSFVTDIVQYNATKGTADYLVDKDSVPEGYLDSCIAYVRAKFALSLEIVQNDYYRIFYDFAESVGND